MADDPTPESVDQCPWVRLTPHFERTEREAFLGGGRVSIVAPITIHVEIAIAGTDADDAIDLWCAMVDAVDTENDPDFGARISALGVRDIAHSPPPVAIATEGAIAKGEASFQLELIYST